MIRWLVPALLLFLVWKGFFSPARPSFDDPEHPDASIQVAASPWAHACFAYFVVFFCIAGAPSVRRPDGRVDTVQIVCFVLLTAGFLGAWYAISGRVELTDGVLIRRMPLRRDRRRAVSSIRELYVGEAEGVPFTQVKFEDRSTLFLLTTFPEAPRLLRRLVMTAPPAAIAGIKGPAGDAIRLFRHEELLKRSASREVEAKPGERNEPGMNG